MNDVISRQTAIKIIKNYCENGCDIAEDNWCPSCQREQFIKLLEALPSAQPERETAKFIRWMECKKTANYISYTPHCKCSKCGTEFLFETIKYCYMCGAKMEENDEDR